ncbi:hypothetical protein OH491_17245 [Termitidicoccus mucosus]|uniref:CBM-cenC domain-containing protein n=1 Tax=Termitidicoccus mucosus TaxID=1184151 RepID=A0A178IJ32_9BACT|nr:hypothetical protein AW736_11345 [Opitutaceae bacterium TSB47]
MKKNNCSLSGLLTLIFSLSIVQVSAQIEIDEKLQSSGYTQSFDSLPMYGTQEWVDNVTIPGWFSTETTIVAGYGGQKVTPQPGLYSLGDDTGTPADRSLGATASAKKRISIGLRLVNKTDKAINKMDLSFVIKQFRAGDPSNAVKVWYKAGKPGEATLADASGWREVKAGHYENQITGNQQVRPVAEHSRTVTFSRMSWKPGSEVIIRWSFSKRAANGASLGIDNLVIKNFSTK